MEEKQSQEQNEQGRFLPLAEKAHGIKNILQAIKGGVDVMDRAMETKQYERAEKGWSILRDNLGKINDLVLDMLEYSRQSKLVLGSCQLNHLIETVVQGLQPKLNEKEISLTCELDSAVKVLSLDIDRINDVLLNLIINAIDAVEEGKGQIRITTRLERDTQQVVVTVKDNGVGIDDTDSVFLPFHSSKSTGGTGLGLSIARKTIDLHGGTITVNSRPHKGAEFIVSLPVCKA